MDLGLFGGWSSMAGAPVVFYLYAVLLLRLAGKTTVSTARVFDFVCTVTMKTTIGSTIVSRNIALTTDLAGLTALVGLQWAVAHASSRSGRFYRLATNTPRLLYDSSRLLEENLRAERLTRQDVLAKVRENGHARAPLARRSTRSLYACLTATSHAAPMLESVVHGRPSREAGERERRREDAVDG